VLSSSNRSENFAVFDDPDHFVIFDDYEFFFPIGIIVKKIWSRQRIFEFVLSQLSLIKLIILLPRLILPASSRKFAALFLIRPAI